MHFETKAIHAGADPMRKQERSRLRSICRPRSSEAIDGQPAHGYSYVRDANPTQSRLEEALAAIDSAAGALVFGSGMAAGAALLQSLAPGSHVLFPDDCYYGFRILATDFFPNWSLTADFVAMEDLDAVRRSMRPQTKVLWAETPSNPLMKIVDIAALVGIAREGGATMVVDGTFASPALQRPVELGADIVLQSTTKYLGGHSDVQGGSLAFARRDSLFEATMHTRHITGGVASPFNSWLVLRGLRSLGARMRVHCENARAVAELLSKHPRVAVVHYPGLSTHPRHDVAARQMSDFGGMLSFEVEGRPC